MSLTTPSSNRLVPARAVLSFCPFRPAPRASSLRQANRRGGTFFLIHPTPFSGLVFTHAPRRFRQLILFAVLSCRPTIVIVSFVVLFVVSSDVSCPSRLASSRSLFYSSQGIERRQGGGRMACVFFVFNAIFRYLTFQMLNTKK